MSILDSNIEVNLEEYYIDKIVNFFKKNGPNGFGLLTTVYLIEPKYLFQVCTLENVVSNPEAYRLCVAKVGDKFFLKIYPEDTVEWGGYAPVQKKIQLLYGLKTLSRIHMSDIL